MMKNPFLRLYKKGKKRLSQELGWAEMERLGLDIGTRFIKLVSITYSSGKPRLKWAGLREVSRGEEEKKIAESIADLWREGGNATRRTKEVIINLSISPTIHRLEFPDTLSDEEVKEAALLEVGQLIPNLENMESDVKLFRIAEAKKVGVLFIAAPTTAVSQRVKLVEKSGLSPVCMDIDSMALLNSAIQLGEANEKQSLLLLNIGTSFTNLAIIRKGGLPFLRDIPQGSQKILPTFGNSSTSMEEAEILTQIEHSIEYYRTRDKVESIGRILLTGGAIETPHIYEYFSKNMHILPERWNPLLKMTCLADEAVTKQFIEKEGVHFAVPLGLALQSEEI
ncbi:MAG: Cell division protein FtsA [Dehalococcoidia bacterium]|nr:Cell division protein FtsA [Bacillota bacterium]